MGLPAPDARADDGGGVTEFVDLFPETLWRSDCGCPFFPTDGGVVTPDTCAGGGACVFEDSEVFPGFGDSGVFTGSMGLSSEFLVSGAFAGSADLTSGF